MGSIPTGGIASAVQEWMGHADIRTTMKYLHYAPHEEDARLVAEAFGLPLPPAPAPKV